MNESGCGMSDRGSALRSGGAVVCTLAQDSRRGREFRRFIRQVGRIASNRPPLRSRSTRWIPGSNRGRVPTLPNLYLVSFTGFAPSAPSAEFSESSVLAKSGLTKSGLHGIVEQAHPQDGGPRRFFVRGHGHDPGRADSYSRPPPPRRVLLVGFLLFSRGEAAQFEQPFDEVPPPPPDVIGVQAVRPATPAAARRIDTHRVDPGHRPGRVGSGQRIDLPHRGGKHLGRGRASRLCEGDAVEVGQGGALDARRPRSSRPKVRRPRRRPSSPGTSAPSPPAPGRSGRSS